MNFWSHQFSKIELKNLKDSALYVLQGWILQIFRFVFWKVNDFKNSFWNLLTFICFSLPYMLIDYYNVHIFQQRISLLQVLRSEFQIAMESFQKPWRILMEKAHVLDVFSGKVNPNWHEGGYFHLLVLFISDFGSWIFIKNF